MNNLRILLIGQPNVGKSSLLNAVVGPIVTVSNYPGTTVEITRAEKIINQKRIEFIDTPGIYSISDRSEEEKVTKNALLKQAIDGGIVIADATSLERSLYMTLQILEAEISVILALNFVEDAEKKGLKIDCEKLNIILNIPIIKINPLTDKGINDLVRTVSRIKELPRETFHIEYDDHIENSIETISNQISETSLPKRFIALRILEGDDDFYIYLKNKDILKDLKEGLEEHPRIAEDIAITRYGTASYIAEKVTEITKIKEEKHIWEKIDRVLLNALWGPLLTGLFLLSFFGALLVLGNNIQNFLMLSTENFLSNLRLGEQTIISTVFVNGLTGIAAGVSIALPYVFLFYILLGLLEDIGVLSRFIVNTERFLRHLGLPGKTFIPLALGLGCTVPAIRATRVLSSEKDQFHVATLFAFTPCSSRIAIIMGIVGYYGGIYLALSVFITSIVSGLIWAYGIKEIIQITSEPLLLELPPYRRPLIKNILAKSWIRMKDFVYIVMPLLAVGGMAYGILNKFGVTDLVVQPISPLSNFLGLPKLTIIPIMFGFLQKDLTGAMLISVLEGNINTVLNHVQLYTFGVATTIGIPCIIALGMLVKEFGYKKAIILTIASIVYGFIIAGIAWRIITNLQLII